MITIQVDDQAVQRALQRLRERVGNLQPVLKDVGEDIVQRTKARFGTSTGPDGQRWRPKKKADGRPTLIGETGNLSRQIVWRVSGNALLVQATMKYAAIHQFGGTIQRQGGDVAVRHRTNARGELLRTEGFGGKGLIFAKKSHKRAQERVFKVQDYLIKMPARPFLPVRQSGQLYPAEQAAIVAQLQSWLAGAGGARG